MDFTGNMVALVTPFRDGSVDLPAVGALIDRVIEGGVSAVLPCGTTGESPTLSHEEHDEVVAFAVERASGRVMVIAGAGSNSTREAVRLTRAAAKAGADAVLSVSPYYNKPTSAGLVDHFRAIADSTDLPVVLYDIPGRCGVALGLPCITTLAEHPHIQAIKVATGNVEHVTEIRRATGLAILSGDDSLTLAMMALGARGVVSVLSNILPVRVNRLVTSALEGDIATARAEHDAHFPLMRSLFIESNPAPVKAALARMGLIANELRLPLRPVSPASMSRLEQDLAPFMSELGN
jgi:4-hydroxy-tetrahydrodipicolinate synthase